MCFGSRPLFSDVLSSGKVLYASCKMFFENDVIKSLPCLLQIIMEMEEEKES